MKAIASATYASGRSRSRLTRPSAAATAWSAGVGPAAMARAGRTPTSTSAAAGARAGFRRARRGVTSLARVPVNPVAAVVGRRQEGEVRRDALVVQVHAVADVVVDVVLA